VCTDTTPVPAHEPVDFSCACTRFFTGRVCTWPAVFVTSSEPPTVSLEGQMGTLFGHGFTDSLRVVDIAVDGIATPFNFSRFDAAGNAANSTGSADSTGSPNRRLLQASHVYAVGEGNGNGDVADNSVVVSGAGVQHATHTHSHGVRGLMQADDPQPLFYWKATFNIPAAAVEGYRPLNVSFANAGGISYWSSSALVFAKNGTCLEAGEYGPISGRCKPCEASWWCPGGGRIWPGKGWWSSNEQRVPAICPNFQACPGVYTVDETLDTRVLRPACVKGETPFECLDASRASGSVGGAGGGGVATAVCSVGYEGAYCGACADTYYDGSLVSGSLKCVTCGGSDADKALIRIMIVAVLIVIGLICAAVVLLSAEYLTVVVELLIMLQEVVAITKGSIDSLPTNWTVVRDAIGLLFVINWEIDVVKPGCEIPFLSFEDVYYTMLVLTVLSFFIFAVGAYVRASFIYAKIQWAKRNHGKKFPGFGKWVKSKLPCWKESGNIDNLGADAADDDFADSYDEADDDDDDDFADIYPEFLPATPPDTPPLAPRAAVSLATALERIDADTDSDASADADVVVDISADASAHADADAEANAGHPWAVRRKYVKQAYPLPLSIANDDTDGDDWVVPIQPYDEDAYRQDAFAAASRRQQSEPPPPPPPPPPPGAFASSEVPSERSTPPEQAEMKLTELAPDAESLSSSSGSQSRSGSNRSSVSAMPDVVKKPTFLARMKGKVKEKFQEKKRVKKEANRLLGHYSFSELFYRRFMHSTLILGWIMYLRVSTLTCK
jgi:hypothetical protein